MQKIDEEREFVIRPGRPKIQHDKYGHFPKPLRVILRKADRIRARNRKDARKAKGITGLKIPGPQCIVRNFTFCAYRGRAAWRASGKYLAINKPGQETPWEVFDAAGVVSNPREKLGEWYDAGDPRVYKIVISPNDKSLDLKALTRDMMEGVAAELCGSKFIAAGTGVPYNAPLEWMAAAHYDTTYHHVHVTFRARAAGKIFVLPSSQWEQGGALRRCASAAIDKQLQLQKQREKSVGRETGMPQQQRARA